MRRRGSENRGRPRRRGKGGGSRGRTAALSDLGAIAPVVTGTLTRKFLYLPVWAWAGVAAGGGLALWAVFSKGGSMKLDATQQAVFTNALPTHARPYAAIIIRVAEEAGADPFAIFALGDRESLWGAAGAYRQQTGDWGARSRPVSSARAKPEVYKILSDDGVNAKVMPADGLGWGRGLMQIDWEQQFAWVSSHDWRDSYQNVTYGASYLKTLLGIFSSQNGLSPVATGGSVMVSPSYANWINQIQKRSDLKGGIFKDPRPLAGKALQGAAVAAYNTGPSNVVRNLALGLTPEASTTGGDYTGDTMKRQSDLIARYTAGGGTMPA